MSSSKEHKPKHAQLVLVGNVSSGKSSLLEFIGHNFSTTTIPADELYKTNPFFQNDRFIDSKRWSFTSNTWFLSEKIKLLSDLPELLENSVVLIDSGLVMSLVYANFCLLMNYFEKDELDLFTQVYDQMTESVPTPDTIIWLQAPVTLSLERIAQRGREYEIQTYDQKYLDNLESAIDETMDSMSAKGIHIQKMQSGEIDFSNPRGEWYSFFQKKLRK